MKKRMLARIAILSLVLGLSSAHASIIGPDYDTDPAYASLRAAQAKLLAGIREKTTKGLAREAWDAEVKRAEQAGFQARLPQVFVKDMSKVCALEVCPLSSQLVRVANESVLRSHRNAYVLQYFHKGDHYVEILVRIRYQVTPDTGDLVGFTAEEVTVRSGVHLPQPEGFSSSGGGGG